ncbi:hypothetical protein BDZ88DRAFT_145022 [Geranomyces variabilis]|nr:hypothetical protein BDZ88DRAFT_145022 [Geranomyces variabilis]KAJ3143367.1 hypothetical protein HDU90_000127 [Geranomyces variabilis]
MHLLLFFYEVFLALWLAVAPPVPPPLPPYQYYCNLTEYPSMLLEQRSPWPQDNLAAAALKLLSLVQHTSYAHVSQIDPATGTFMTDCSCVVSYLLVNSGLGQHFADVPKEKHDTAVQPPMPRAKEYAQFLESLKKHGRGGRDGDGARWTAVQSIWALQPGDLVAWVIPDWKAEGKSTGHVLVVVDPPPPARAGGRNTTLIPADETSVWVSVLDSSSIAHQWDSRCDAADSSGKKPCAFGVGHSFIRLLGDAMGEPKAFQFRDGAAVRAYPLSLARVIGEPSWDYDIVDRSTLVVQKSSR